MLLLTLMLNSCVLFHVRFEFEADNFSDKSTRQIRWQPDTPTHWNDVKQSRTVLVPTVYAYWCKNDYKNCGIEKFTGICSVWGWWVGLELHLLLPSVVSVLSHFGPRLRAKVEVISILVHNDSSLFGSHSLRSCRITSTFVLMQK